VDLAQSFAVVIFLGMFITIMIGKTHRMIPALIGAALTVIVAFLIIQRNFDSIWQTFNLGSLLQYHFWIPKETIIEVNGINWQTIIFIGGMMILIECLNRAGLFRWLCLYVTRLTHARVNLIFIVFIILSGFLAMFISSITVMLFLAVITIELSRLLRFDPVPMLIAEIFAANIGGAATMCGDPPSIIIGTSLGFGFMDFISNTGAIAWASMVVTGIFFYFSSVKTFVLPVDSDLNDRLNACPAPRTAITSYPLFMANMIIFILLVALLVSHAQTGLSLALIAVIEAILGLIIARQQALSIISKVDWRTLLFLIGLFVCVGGLEETGVLNLLADSITSLSGDNPLTLISVLLWATAFVSFIVDNIPLAAIMVPVISNVAINSGMNLSTLAWTISLGINIGGNATPIGASANVVTTAIAENQGIPISWGRFCKFAVPATIIVAAVAWGLLILRYL
jgi:Na+/H+ antiporter NhaD/arsenite permease-like protein